MEPYACGYRDALRAQEEYHQGQIRHCRNAVSMDPAERHLLLREHTAEVERLRKQIEDLERAATPIPMPGPSEPS